MLQAPQIPAKLPPKPQKTQAAFQKNSTPKILKTTTNPQATPQKIFVCHTDEFCYIDKVLVILSFRKKAKYP